MIEDFNPEFYNTTDLYREHTMNFALEWRKCIRCGNVCWCSWDDLHFGPCCGGCYYKIAVISTEMRKDLDEALS